MNTNLRLHAECAALQAWRVHQVKARSQFFAPLAVAAIVFIVAGVFWPTFAYMVGFGSRPDNHANSALVIAVFFALIWSQRAGLSLLPVRPYFPGLIGLAGVGIIWLGGELLLMRVLTQFAVLAMVPMVVLTLLGRHWFRATILTSLILLFALPMWGPIVPTLVNWTAEFVEVAIRVSGVPIYREGAFFVIPSGSWSIADACSGIAYLSTCAMLGILYAWTMYQSTIKRMAFVAGAILIGVVGNWIRAYLTIIIAHFSDNRLLRDDHSTFGWILFAILLFLYFRLGWAWRDDVTENRLAGQLESETTLFAGESPERPSAFRIAAILAATVASLITFPAIELLLSARHQVQPVNIATIAPQSGWSAVDRPAVEWTPALQSPYRMRVQTFEKTGRRVDVYIGVFRNQNWDSKLVTVSNQLANPENSDWTVADRGALSTELAGRPLKVKTGVLLGRTSRILAWQWYWVDGASTSSDIGAKIHQLATYLRGKGDTAAWVAVYSDASVSADNASNTLSAFMQEMGGAVDGSIAETINL